MSIHTSTRMSFNVYVLALALNLQCAWCLQNVRVVQRNLVYAVGLAMELCYEDTLMGPEYFGAFGKMVKQMSVNRMGPYGSSVSRNGPTGSAYITFKRPEDAKRCIEAVNGAVWGGKLRRTPCTGHVVTAAQARLLMHCGQDADVAGKQVKACFGTTKYCNAFLKGVICNNPECLYLHDIGTPLFTCPSLCSCCFCASNKRLHKS